MDRRAVAVSTAGTAVLVAVSARAATLDPHVDVGGAEVTTCEVRRAGGAWRPVAWDALDSTRIQPGEYEVRYRADVGAGGDAVSVPTCAGRRAILVDGHPFQPASAGPAVVPAAPGAHEVTIPLTVTAYERRIACGEPPRAGPRLRTIEGLGVLSFPSSRAARGGGYAVVYVPPGHDLRDPRPLLVGLHPWNGLMWTYAAYASLLREARSRDVLLLLPSGLGNSLYTSDAEDEVLQAVEEVSSVMAVDPRAISVWGASMGGAGATTIAFHRPDRFAGVTSFFGDSKYDRGTYVRFILPSEAAVHAVNALDVVDNARSLPVWLVHGEQDRTSPIRQSALLASALRERGFAVRFDPIADAGHDGALVARFLPRVVDIAASARAASRDARVTYRSVRERDTGAYGVRLERASPVGDAFVDVERRADAVHVLRAEGVRAIVLARGALGASVERPPPIVVDEAGGVTARWDVP